MKSIWRRAWKGSDEMFGFNFKANHQMTFLMPIKGKQPEEPSGKDFLPLENLWKERKKSFLFKNNLWFSQRHN